MTRLLLKAGKLAAILRVSAWRNALRRYRVAAGAEHLPVLRQFTGCRGRRQRAGSPLTGQSYFAGPPLTQSPYESSTRLNPTR